jgi:hypothetical protein
MEIDHVFRKPIEADLIPGVVALAADHQGAGAWSRDFRWAGQEMGPDVPHQHRRH